jgi:hypothetical protein
MTYLATEAMYAAMTDVEVVHELWRAIGVVEDDDLMGEPYYLTGELLERFTPDLEREATGRDYSDDERDLEMPAHEESLARRAELRSMLAPLAGRTEAELARTMRGIGKAGRGA